MTTTKREREQRATAGNGRFGAMAALAPQQRQCELGSYYPAGTLVKPPLRQAAGTLAAMRRKRRRETIVLKRNYCPKVQ